MTLEATIKDIVDGVVTRVYPDVAPAGTTPPYAVYQALGGQTLRMLSGAAGSHRNTLMQVAVWSTTRVEANSKIRGIEDALCASAAIVCRPEGEPLSVYENDTKLYGAIQRFSIYSER